MNKKTFPLLLAFLAIAMVGCHKENNAVKGRGYTVVSKIPSLIINQYDVDAHVYEYNTRDMRIDSFLISLPRRGEEYTRKVGDSVSHIKFCITSFDTNVRWGDTIIFMHSNDNIRINIDIDLLYSTFAFHEPLLHK